jgi:hypothetical protein
MKDETDKLAGIHAELSNQFSQAAKRMNEFVTRQKAESKQVCCNLSYGGPVAY